MKKNRVYIVMYNFLPIGIGRGIAWNHFADKLARNNYDVELITVLPSLNDPYYNKDKLNIINKSYKLTRIKDNWLYYKLYSKNKFNNNEHIIENKNTNNRINIKNYLIKFYRKLSRILFYPDRMVFWSKKVRKYLENKNITSKDIIISVGFPFSTHIEMNKLKRKKGCKLILDYGDPWSFNPSSDTEPKWRRSFDEKIEKNILKNTDVITVTTDKTKEKFVEKFNVSNVHVIRQGVDLTKYLEEHENIKNEIITLVYTGIFYKDIRDPSTFFDALKKVDKKINFMVEIKIAGRIDAYFEEIIKRKKLNEMRKIKVNFLGNVGLDECIDLQKKADMLLFFSNKEGIQVPGKIYEYLATNNPIISISYAKGETENIIETCKRGIVVLNNNNMEEEILNILNQYYKDKKILGVSNEPVYNYDWKNISDQLLDIIREENL